VAGDYRYLLSPARCGDIKQFLAHSIGGDDDGIDGFSLATMRGNGVSMSELPEIGRENAAIIQMNSSGVIDSRDRDDFSICCAKLCFSTIGREQQLVARCDFNCSPVEHIERFRLFLRKDADLATFFAS